MEEYKNYLELKGYQTATVKSLIRAAGEYKEYTGRGNLPQNYLTYLSQRKNKNHPEETLTKSTLNHHIYGLKVYVNYLETIQKQTVNLKLLNHKKELKTIEVLTVEEVKQLFAATLNSRDKAALACLYHLGLRVSEAAHLIPEDVDFKENLVLIRKSKTGWQRQVPMSENAREIFQHYLQQRQAKGETFLQGIKGNLTPDGIAQILRRTVKKLRIEKKVHPHLLRHSIATHLLQSGMELEKVSLFLGHRSLESTQRYAHLF